MQLIIMTSDTQYHCLNPYLYLWNKYFEADIKIVICGFSTTDLIAQIVAEWGIQFFSIGRFEDYPTRRWSNAFIKVLNEVADETFIFMLEDYWLTRPVDTQAVQMLYNYANDRDYILKIDTAFDRLYMNGGSNFYQGQADFDNVGHIDILHSPVGSQYQMSLWGGIFNREALKTIVVPGETAQQLELNGTRRVNDLGSDIAVYGTRQAPIRHGNIYQSRHSGKPVYHDIGWAIKEADLEHMRSEGWIE